MSTQSNRDNEDRKAIRRASLSKKKNHIKIEDMDEYKARNKVSKEYKSKKTNMIQEELWEDWEEELDKYKK